MGNSKSHVLGFTSHTEFIRPENDFYSTDPREVEKLLEREIFEGTIWECACGNGAMSEALRKHYPYSVFSSDLYDRGYGVTGENFLTSTKKYDNIITNPPYKYALEFVQHALKLSNKKVAMFLKLTFLEGKGRYHFFKENPPAKVYVFSYRAMCYRNGDKTIKNSQSSSIAYAWFVWEKGYKGKTEIEWII